MTNSFSNRVDPIGTVKLGSGNKAKSYKANIPGVWSAAFTLKRLANMFTVQFSGEHESVGPGSPHTNKTILSGLPTTLQRRFEHDTTLTDTLVTSCLLGKRFLSVQSFDVEEKTYTTTYKRTDDPIPIRYRSVSEGKAKSIVPVVAIEFSPTNTLTGEMFDAADISHLFAWLEQKHLFYTNGSSFCLVLWLPALSTYSDALEYLKQLSTTTKEKVGIAFVLEQSSLFKPIPLPLTVTKTGQYCEIIGVSAHDSEAAIVDFLETKQKEKTAKTPQSSPVLVEEPRDDIERESHLESSCAAVDYVVCKQFFDALTNLLKAKALPENTTPKKLTETRKLLGYVLFSRHRDKSGNLILSSEALSQAIYGSTKRARGNNFNSSAMLKLLDPVATLETTKPNYKNNLATTLKTIQFSDEFECIWTEERQKLRRDLVWLSNGKNTLKHQAAILSYQREKAQNSTTLFPCDIASKLMKELNNQKPNIYTKIYNNGISRALMMVRLLEDDSKLANLSTLDKIRLQPIPIYHRTLHTNRLAQSGGFFNLSGSIRNTFFSGYFMADVSHCQLSINSLLWECKKMQDKLKEGNIWEYLCNSSGLSKEEAKSGMMLLMYGQSAKPPKNSPLLQLSKTPEVRALIESKAAFIKKITGDGFAYDAFQNIVKIDPLNTSSALSSISQSYEFLLLRDIFNHYITIHEKDTSKTFQILLYTIDGFIYSCDARYEIGIREFLQRTFQNKAMELGIFTSLQIQKLP